MHRHDFNAHRYSPLDLINKGNVKNLKLEFAVALADSGRLIWLPASSAFDAAAFEGSSGIILRESLGAGSRPVREIPRPRS
jgi:hypothetical protein